MVESQIKASYIVAPTMTFLRGFITIIRHKPNWLELLVGLVRRDVQAHAMADVRQDTPELRRMFSGRESFPSSVWDEVISSNETRWSFSRIA